MFDQVADAVQVLHDSVGSLDTAVVQASRTKRLVALFAEAERLVAAGKTLCAARSLLDAAEQLAELPRVAEAFRSGQLSGAQVKAVADAASADPSSEQSLVEVAGREPFGELRDRPP